MRGAVTRDEAIVQIATLTPLSTVDVAGFLACTDEERSALIVAYRDAGVMPTASAWDVVLGALKECAELATLVLSITGAISGVYGLAKGTP